MQLDARPKAEKELEGSVPTVNMTASLASSGKLNIDLASKVCSYPEKLVCMNYACI